MTIIDGSNDGPAHVLTQESELLECLRKIGKGLLASGSAVGVVENTLTEIALAYEMDCEIAALPNILMLKVGQSARPLADFAVQRQTTLQLNQISALTELVDRVQRKHILPGEASRQVDHILAIPQRFGSMAVVLGYLLSVLGLTMLFRPDLGALVITGTTGVLVGLLMLLFQKWPRFYLFLPVVAAMVVSAIIFHLTELGLVYGSANLIIPPLVTFLPGAILTTGMIELASMHLLSGSARLIYGAATLFLLFIGIAFGLNITRTPSWLVSTYEATVFPWWAPLLGTLLFGIGTFIRLSGANRDLLWMLLVLYVAMVGQSIGEQFLNSYFGAFLGATFMALSSELIARSPRRTPALASQMLAFWFLVPGARGLLSVTGLLSEDYQSAAIGLGDMLILIVSIALGVLLGTLIISPHKFVPVMAQTGRPDARGT
jgi:uncharacterized membrane protein YjjP (DUF1212 family)/uncharacterized membrane protein YjjB (DUF3815 family)